ncbi:acyl-CoA dehydrogenase family protein [Ottowia sp.]|uniref:acyl-CoA dehydrogenase family protein n=1 Tax=Ottowia sp. TaxID=1898956 RepID=UPI0025F465FB|nr:acyl-CoA dehydrogenase family protein [Ottowia sp.]MBK6746992.1 acyl-CoA dehydrogenase family protein [Ottowia sp.]
MTPMQIRLGEMPPECEVLRQEVRAFLRDALAGFPIAERAKSWQNNNREFSRKLGARGWLGMTWPKQFGGQGRSPLERYVVIEELLAAGAPVGYHWISERQSGPLLIRYAPDTLAPKLVPLIAKGELGFCAGLSEPDSGSDLASIRTKAKKVEGGWEITGRKVWTSRAHDCEYMIALVRTGEKNEDRHAGLSQFLVDITLPGIEVRPIQSQLGTHTFNEVVLDGVFVPDECLIGVEGQGWSQVLNELKHERSGPERFLSSTQLYQQMIKVADLQQDSQTEIVGRVFSKYLALRSMSQGIALMMARGEDPAVQASLVKDQGAVMEQSIPQLASDYFTEAGRDDPEFVEAIDYLTVAAPSFSLRGGTREILRGIIARGLGLR